MRERLPFAMTDGMDTIGSRIAAIRSALGMTQQAFADAITAHLKRNPVGDQPDAVSRGAVGNWEGGKPVGLRNLRAIAELWDVSIDWLSHAKGEPPALLLTQQPKRRAVYGSRRTTPDLEPSFAIAPPRRKMLEFRGVAQGSLINEFEGMVIIHDQVIDRVPMPPHLEDVEGIYGIYVRGDSMDPMHKQGEPRIVHPGRPVRPDDSVVVQTRRWEDDPGQAYIKLFRRFKGDSVVLEQLNPPAVLEIPNKYVSSMHHVLTMSEVLGLF
jgi:phage repressor protein C with HTH and peptisase S24 domain